MPYIVSSIFAGFLLMVTFPIGPQRWIGRIMAITFLSLFAFYMWQGPYAQTVAWEASSMPGMVASK